MFFYVFEMSTFFQQLTLMAQSYIQPEVLRVYNLHIHLLLFILST